MDLTLLQDEDRRDELFLVDLERFQGPLDLLLHLIRTQDIDVFDIPIATITDQFLQAIRGVETHDLDGAGEFLEMAATLIHLKAQMLLPRPSDEEDEDPRAELVRRLLEYEQIRDVSHRLSVAEADRARRFGKGYVPPRPRKPIHETPLETTWEEVMEAAMEVEVPEARDHEHRVTTRTVAMEDKVVLILDTLKDATRVEFSRLLHGFRDRMHGVMTFLAGLELTRRRLLFLRQARPFSELWIYRREEGDAEPEKMSMEDEAPPEPRRLEAALDGDSAGEAAADGEGGPEEGQVDSGTEAPAPSMAESDDHDREGAP